MNKCNRCNVTFTDGVQCASCKKIYDFSCAGITEAGYRKLGADRRAAWKCTYCKNIPVEFDEPVSLEMILNEVREMKSQLSSLPVLVEDVKGIKRELSELRLSCEFNGEELDECTRRLDTVELKIPVVDHLMEMVKSSEDSLAQFNQIIVERDQWSRLNNVEIKGVPVKKEENLFSVVKSISKHIKHSISKSSINYIARVHVHNSKEKSIVACFTNRYVKKDFVAAARSFKNLQASDIGFKDNVQRVYVNDHLTPESKALLTKIKSVLKDKKGYEFVWFQKYK